MKSFLLFALCALLLAAGCTKNNDNDLTGNWEDSVFIINEGPFPTGTGTISAYNRENGEVSHDLFKSVNGRPLGNIVQSMSIHEGYGYIVVNNANKVEVVDMKDFKSVATIDDLTLPRYFVGYDENKGYVSCWDSTVKVIDLNTFTVTSSVKAGGGPDEMLIFDNKLFVINSGGYDVDNRVTVIDTETDQLIMNITVGYTPVSIVRDHSNTIWVLCAGRGWNGYPGPNDTRGELVRISPETLEIIDSVLFPDEENHPDNLVADETGAVFYYNMPRGIFSFSVAFGSVSSDPLIPAAKMYYGLGYDKTEGVLYAADRLDFSQNGWIFRYDVYPSAALIDSIPAGIGPNGFCFNP